MADLHIKQGGAWTPIANCKVKIGGAWTQVKKAYVRVAGTWQEVWSNWVVTLTNASAIGLGNTGVGFRWNSDGTIDRTTNGGLTWSQINASTDWIIPNSETSAESCVIRFTEFSASAQWQYLTGGTLVDGSTWHALTSNRTIYGNSSTGAEATCVLTVEISADGGSTTLDSGTFSFSDEDIGGGP